MTAPRISLMRQGQSTSFVPLVALGWYIRTQDLLSPLWARAQFGRDGYHVQDPQSAILDVWVSILAGCQSIGQINTKIRPDGLLAKAWGRSCFHEQSTLARMLDGCTAEDVLGLRTGVEAVYRWIGAAPQRDPARPTLMIDIDLTGMLASKRAQRSTKGYFSQKRGSMVVSCAG